MKYNEIPGKIIEKAILQNCEAVAKKGNWDQIVPTNQAGGDGAWWEVTSDLGEGWEGLNHKEYSPGYGAALRGEAVEI